HPRRRVPVPDPRSARVPRRPLRPGLLPPEHGARPGGLDRAPDPSSPRGHDVPRASPRVSRIDRRPSASADEQTSLGGPTGGGPPPPGGPFPGGEFPGPPAAPPPRPGPRKEPPGPSKK